LLLFFSWAVLSAAAQAGGGGPQQSQPEPQPLQPEPGAQEPAPPQPAEPAIDPHYLLRYLPGSLSGESRAATTSGIERRAPVAGAVYAGESGRRELVFQQLYRDAGSAILAEAREEAVSSVNISIADRSYEMLRFGGDSKPSYAIAPAERFLIRLAGNVADADEAQTLFSEIDIAGLLAFEPPQEGYETAELYADDVPMRVSYPASWILVEIGRSGKAARTLLLMSEPIELAELLDEETPLLLGDRIAATILVLPQQDRFSTQNYMISTPALIPYHFRQSRPTVRPEPAPEYGPEAGYAAYRAIDFSGRAVQVRELVYKPGERFVQLHLLAPERRPFGIESTFGQLAAGIAVTIP